MQCQWCKSEVDPRNVTCPNCGGTLAAAGNNQFPSTAPQSAPPYNQQAQFMPGPAPAPKKSRMPIIITIVLVLICVVVCIPVALVQECSQNGTQIAIPDVTGMSPDDAEDTITMFYKGGSSNWSVVFTVNGEPTAKDADDLTKAGYVVVSQKPLPGEEHMGNEKVKVTLDLKSGS